MEVVSGPVRAMQLEKSDSRATAAYIAPFLVFVGVMTIEKSLSLPRAYGYPLRFVLSLAAIVFLSRGYVSFRPSAPLASIGIGVLVLIIWVAPDQLFGYRHHWLFENSVTGKAASSLPAELQGNIAFLILRSISSFALVPVLEELFWRGWLMRWLIDRNFLKVPLGTYDPFVLDCGGAVCVRARTLLGSRPGRWNHLQLVDRPDA